MNLERLKKAENQFLSRYPGGFEHPDLVQVLKKHKMERMVDLAQQGASAVPQPVDDDVGPEGPRPVVGVLEPRREEVEQIP